MMKLACGIRPEELILFTDGALRGGRGELVEAHLRVCPICRQWLADFAETGRLLRESTPPVDSAAARARIMARLAADTDRRRRRARPRTLAAVVALALAVLVALAFPRQGSEARMSVGRFFAFVERGALRSALVGGATPTSAPRPTSQPLAPDALAALPFTPQVPTMLPLGLRLEGGTIAKGRELALYYRNDRDLIMLLTQRRAADVGHTRIIGGGEVIIIGGVEVVVQTEPRTRTVAVLTWENRGTLYELSVDAAPEGLLTLAEARQLVEALLAGR